MKRKTACIIGSGIAGLSIAEILSRNGWKVLILESRGKIGGEATLATQKWFHTGWLYAALPNPEAMLGCFKALHLYHEIYDSILSNEELNFLVTPDNEIKYFGNEDGWFHNERINYLFALSTFDLPYWKKKTWPIYLKYQVFRRIRKLYKEINVVVDFDYRLRNLLDYWEESPDSIKKYKIIRSTDAKIDTDRVLKSLFLNLSENTEIITDANYSLQSSGNDSIVKIGNVYHKPDLMILASGKSIPTHLNMLGAQDLAEKIKTVKSPILLIKRELDLPDFIRFTPNVHYTINHLRFCTENHGRISTLGSYFSYPLDYKPDLREFEDLMCQRMDISRDLVLGSYFGFKTEFTGKSDRRYNHAVMKVNNNTFFALAGKFSQFPLLVKDFMDQISLSSKRQERMNMLNGTTDVLATTFPEFLKQYVEDVSRRA